MYILRRYGVSISQRGLHIWPGGVYLSAWLTYIDCGCVSVSVADRDAPPVHICQLWWYGSVATPGLHTSQASVEESAETGVCHGGKPHRGGGGDAGGIFVIRHLL